MSKATNKVMIMPENVPPDYQNAVEEITNIMEEHVKMHPNGYLILLLS